MHQGPEGNERSKETAPKSQPEPQLPTQKQLDKGQMAIHDALSSLAEYDAAKEKDKQLRMDVIAKLRSIVVSDSRGAFGVVGDIRSDDSWSVISNAYYGLDEKYKKTLNLPEEALTIIAQVRQSRNEYAKNIEEQMEGME